MKYTRTKDGRIFLILEETKKEIVVLCEGELTCINKRKILKQSDTIEELCDYVFLKDWEGKLQIQKMFGGNKQIRNLLLNGATEIKLAILTDKGLIYVAKMNDKGELELL